MLPPLFLEPYKLFPHPDELVVFKPRTKTLAHAEPLVALEFIKPLVLFMARRSVVNFLLLSVLPVA